MASILTYLQQAQIRDSVQTLEGEILSRPSLLKTDGTNVTWACDVRIPGYDDPLRLVPVAMNNRELLYADVGQAVTLARSLSGRFEVTGFSKRKPGRRVRIGVNLRTGQALPPEDTTLTARSLTYAELELYGGYGVVPYGSYGMFRGGVLVGLNGAVSRDDLTGGN